MSPDLLAIALPPLLGSVAADAVAPWGSLTTIQDHDRALGALSESPPRLVVMVAAGLDDLTTAEGIRAAHPDAAVCLLAPEGMTDRLAVHCMHRSRAQVIVGPPLTAERIREQIRSLLPQTRAPSSGPGSVPADDATVERPPAPPESSNRVPASTPTQATVTVDHDPEADLREELSLARSIAEEAAGEVARLRAAARRHQRAAEAAHQDLAETRASAAEARRRTQKAEAERDAATAERDDLAADVTILQEEAAAARAESGRLAQALGALEAEQEQRAAQAEWGARASAGMRARLEELQAQLEAARADAEHAHREHTEARSALRAEAGQAEGATRAALAELAALRAAGPGRVAELEDQVARLERELDELRMAGERERAEAHELRIALTRQQHQLASAEAEASRLRDTVAAHDERAVVLVEGLRRAEAAARQADLARTEAETDAAEARAQQLQDITWFMEQLRDLRSEQDLR